MGVGVGVGLWWGVGGGGLGGVGGGVITFSSNDFFICKTLTCTFLRNINFKKNAFNMSQKLDA